MKYNVIISDRAREMLGLRLRFLAQASRPAAVKRKRRPETGSRRTNCRETPERRPNASGVSSWSGENFTVYGVIRCENGKRGKYLCKSHRQTASGPDAWS